VKSTLRKHKYATLLAALILVALVESFSHRLILGPSLSDLNIIAVMLLVFLIVFDRWLNRLVAFIALVTAAVAVFLAHSVLPPSYQVPLRLLYHSAALVLVGFATLVILRNIFGQRIVGTDDVLGAVCGYLLAAGAWSNLFMLTEIFLPGSFSLGPGFGARLDTWDGRSAVSSYVSLGSLTSVGSGAVVPIRPPATVLTTLEAVFGQFYIAVVVAQLVGARLSQALQRNSSLQT
jgi:multisubunit Na+/H+ antiporter MnhF subunit